MEVLPSVDEFVVLSLRAELVAADHGRQPAVDVEYRMLRQIALAYPELTETVWSMIGRSTPLRWSA
jgi:hypothetical protein